MAFGGFEYFKLLFVDLPTSGQKAALVMRSSPHILPTQTFHSSYFSPEAICHDSDTIRLKGDMLTNRIAVSMRFIFPVLNTVVRPLNQVLLSMKNAASFMLCGNWKVQAQSSSWGL